MTTKAEARRLTQAEILVAPALPLGQPATAPAPPAGHLTELLTEQRAKAATVALTDHELGGWWLVQLFFTSLDVARLAGAMEQAMADPRLDDAQSPLWQVYYGIDARYRYTAETLALLTTRAHTLVCPNCGDEGLSLRGALTGEGSTAWSRYCGACVAGRLKEHAARLLAEHRKEVGK